MVVVTTLPPPSHGIRHEQPSTKAFINEREIGNGTLYIAESHLSWVNSGDGLGFSLEYPHISIHAVSRDCRAYSEECLYLMLDTDIDFAAAENVEFDINRPEEENLTELRFVPEDKSCLDVMFSAMNDCQALHPDDQQSISEDENEEEADDDEDEAYYDDFLEPIVRASTNGTRELDMDVDEGQFDDAESSPED